MRMSAPVTYERGPDGLKAAREVATQFGRRFKDWRKTRGLPLKAVASELGVSLQIVSDWERGQRFPTPTHLKRIELYTSTPLCAFFRADNTACPHAE